MEVWLTKNEKQDQALKERLKLLCQQYKGKKYFVAEFLSGNLDLVEETVALLRHNKRSSAEQEVKQAQKRSGSMAR